jgi:CBS domain-containing protein
MALLYRSLGTDLDLPAGRTLSPTEGGRMKIWRVRDVMTTDVATVEEGTPYREIVVVLTGRRVSAVPVVDEFRRVVGVVSEADLLPKVEFAGEPQVRHFLELRRRRDARSKAGGDTARDLMSTPAVTIQPDSSLAAAARLMDKESVKRLPVVDELGRLVGVVSRTDLLQVYRRPDDEIRAEVVEEVLRRSLWLEPGQVKTEVYNGVVTLTGQLDNKTLALLAVRLTESVAGVVEVVDQLGYDFDDTALTSSRSFRSHPYIPVS